ncbi:hypothetical protein SAMN06265182_1304 [Persephonella hydrogeniphila]|uniref:Rad52/22 family double-strand break repair protein n=1 Tax=Persephonella hydrogeniphila TaxID=198703 RepID=A0A285NHL0_9AQUI|nr:hypothetical protein [Persephonella hydrogeniphila]SNZ08477.1 hypothetical protein SAMN06265182_1304 [Persephonella hydrogeniphila]
MERLTPEEKQKLDKQLKEVAKRVNEILDSYGEKALQEVPARGRKLIGYIPQFLIDALNSVTTLWSYDYRLISLEEKEVLRKSGNKEKVYQATVEVSLWILDDRIKKVQIGGGENVTPADAVKGAITDAIGKCLSLYSIGSKAYRGELEFKGVKHVAPEPRNLTATEKQIEYVKTLAKKTNIDYPKMVKQILNKTVRTEEELKNLSAPEISRIIEAYKRIAI